MSMQFTPPSLIGANSTNVTNKAFMDREDAARAAGPVMQYEYKSLKQKKQLKYLKAHLFSITLDINTLCKKGKRKIGKIS